VLRPADEDEDMERLSGRVAVVTGAARGIGLSIATTLAADGMKLVLADVDARGLREAVHDLHAAGRPAIGLRTDVRSAEDVDALARATVEEYGGVDVVCNNAGVWGLGAQWETSLNEWHRIVDINLWGVIHGVRSFTPLLMDNTHGGHIVNTASMAGLIAGPFRGPYTAAKHAVVGMSRGLRAEFRIRKLPIGVSVICPGKVDTTIFDSLGDAQWASNAPQDVQLIGQAIRDVDAIPASSVGPIVCDAIKNDEFWILPGVRNQTRAVRREFEQVLEALAAADR
jgi:NAD(P)-dependent dehydrogenase (short-subunit alcohol dehydrogenase family)